MAARQNSALNKVITVWLRVIPLAWCLVALGAPAQAQIPVVDLGNLGGAQIYPQDISETGIVVGYGSTASGEERAFMWTQATGIVNLGTLGGASYAERVNDAGVVIGYSWTPDGDWHPFRWSQATGMQNLSPPGMAWSRAVAINNNGEIALTAGGNGSLSKAFRWSPTGGYVEIPSVEGESNSFVEAIGMFADGSVVGNYVNSVSGQLTPFIWSPGTGTINLEVIPGTYPEVRKVTQSWVVLEASAGDDGGCHTYRTFVWSAATGMIDIGTRPDSPGTLVEDVNGNGVAVGGSFTCTDDIGNEGWFPNKWSIDSGLQDLDFSGLEDYDWRSDEPYRGVPVAINDNGYIIVSGTTGHGVLLMPDAAPMMLAALDWAAVPVALNNQGVIVGYANTSDFSSRLVIWNYSPASGPNTPTGASVNVTTLVPLPDGSQQDVSVTFDQVTTAGETTVTASGEGPAPPAGFKLTNPQVYYEIDTTAAFSGNARVCVSWSEGQVADESTVSLFHYTGNQWVDITDATSRDTVNNRLCGLTSSFSPFALFDRVKFPFVGFFDPIENGAVVNAAKAGSAIPVKFSLGGDRGLDIFAPGFPRAQLMQCETGAQIDEIGETVSAGGSALTYDPVTDRYTYVWKTDKAWAKSCRQLQVKFTDGATYTAKFTFSK